jgi:pilus assembly protein CpaE
MLTAGVASSDEQGIAYLEACLQQTGLVKSVKEWKLPVEQYPASAESIPEVVLIELTREPEIPLAFAAQVHRVRPSAAIIATSATHQPSPQLLMQAMRSGVREFLPQPIDPELLRETLERLIKAQGLEAAGEEKLIAILGSKGGVGTTTIAVNLAAQMAKLTGKRIALLDFGRPIGHVSLLLDLKPRFSVRDVVESIDRLDSHLLGGLLTEHKSGLQILAGASDPDEWLRISVSTLARVVNVAQAGFDFVLADLGTVYSSEWAALLRMTRQIVMVAETDVPALWTLERHLNTMASYGLAAERFRIVVNRWHRTDEEALKAFEKKIKRPIFARLPNDFRQVSEAVNLGTTLTRNHDDPLGSRLRALAAELAGVEVQAGGKRGSFLGLLSPGKR